MKWSFHTMHIKISRSLLYTSDQRQSCEQELPHWTFKVQFLSISSCVLFPSKNTRGNKDEIMMKEGWFFLPRATYMRTFPFPCCDDFWHCLLGHKCSLHSHLNYCFSETEQTKPLTWISNFQPLTASSVRIFVKDIVNPSRKNRWHASLLTSRPILKERKKEKKKKTSHNYDICNFVSCYTNF